MAVFLREGAAMAAAESTTWDSVLSKGPLGSLGVPVTWMRESVRDRSKMVAPIHVIPILTNSTFHKTLGQKTQSSQVLCQFINIAFLPLSNNMFLISIWYLKMAFTIHISTDILFKIT